MIVIGQSCDDTWFQHACHMIITWFLHGGDVINMWYRHGIQVIIIPEWWSCDHHVAPSGIHMMPAWRSRDHHVISALALHGFPVTFMWLLCCCPTPILFRTQMASRSIFQQCWSASKPIPSQHWCPQGCSTTLWHIFGKTQHYYCNSAKVWQLSPLPLAASSQPTQPQDLNVAAPFTAIKQIASQQTWHRPRVAKVGQPLSFSPSKFSLKDTNFLLK